MENKTESLRSQLEYLNSRKEMYRRQMSQLMLNIKKVEMELRKEELVHAR